jgi:hypothetical protein
MKKDGCVTVLLNLNDDGSYYNLVNNILNSCGENLGLSSFAQRWRH